MSVLICGSFAYDTIMVFRDRFKNHILPDKIHILNVSFLVPEMRREYGGCAGNIAYGLKMLGGDPLPMGTVGKDCDAYMAWLEQWSIPCTHIKKIDAAYTAQAYITTDMDDNQITAFHPGAMSYAHENRIQDAKEAKLGMVSPDGRQGMIEHAAQFAERGIPFVFDPGQGMPMFEADDLKLFIEEATWVTVNDYEAQLMQTRTGWSSVEIVQRVDAYIVTLGAKGCRIHLRGSCIDIPAVPPFRVADPTGCGDAFRAGLLYGLSRGMDWQTTGRIAVLMGTLKIECHGTQNYRYTKEKFAARFKEAYGYDL